MDLHQEHCKQHFSAVLSVSEPRMREYMGGGAGVSEETVGVQTLTRAQLTKQQGVWCADSEARFLGFQSCLHGWRNRQIT